MNINSAEDKSSSLKRKVMPTDHVVLKEKPVGKAIPVVAVSPYSPNMYEDNSDDNCDNTDPKTAVESEQTVRKVPVSSSEDYLGSEQTFVKTVVKHTDSHLTSVHREREQMQQNVPAQVLTKGAVCSENTHAKFSNLSHVDPHKLFYQSKVATAVKKTDVKPNDDLSSLESEVTASGRQEVPLGSDPLTRDTQEGIVPSIGTPV